MPPTSITTGEAVQDERPNWTPLEAVLGNDLACWFMWMFEVRLADGTRLDAYKHNTTRRYLHFTEDGRVFSYRVDGSYRCVDLATAIVQAFSGWERALPTPRDLRLLASAIASARNAVASPTPSS